MSSRNALMRDNRSAAAFLLVALFLTLIPGPAALAQDRNPEGQLGTLGSLMLPRDGTPKHEGSWDRKGGNGDARSVAPGETLTLLDVKGAGIIRRFWVTIAPRSEMTIHRQAILRMYWDDAKDPSVEVPIGDFFGVGFGEQKDYISLPLNETSGGYNCYWPMPFHKSARWTITNLSKRRIDAFYYNVDYTAYRRLPGRLLDFHATWRRENPTTREKNYTILDAQGEGHFCGVALFMQNRRGHGFGFLEGDEMIYVDGEDKPSINGTGTEDYFSSGWYFDRGLYSAPYHGVTILDTTKGRVSAYRWHIEDAMNFKKSLRVTIEHGNQNDTEADYSSVAYYYMKGSHNANSTIPSDPVDLLPYVPPPPLKIPGAIEAESLRATARATVGVIDTQGMEGFAGQWSGETQLWWHPTVAPAELTLQLPAPADGTYELIGYFTRAKDYGKIHLFAGDQELSPVVNLYDPEVVPTGPVSFGRVTLKAGDNPLTIKVLDKDGRSSNYLVGIDAFVLRPVP
ncbi:MAG TPA: glycoside hydrolase family 172 protein [Chthonomonadaceae bacterium]|nr:glycoside hydrolase family 172 protein [Chthonomonadaceae bacterium]